jgi:hypothetical protein
VRPWIAITCPHVSPPSMMSLEAPRARWRGERAGMMPKDCSDTDSCLGSLLSGVTLCRATAVDAVFVVSQVRGLVAKATQVPVISRTSGARFWRKVSCCMQATTISEFCCS